MAFTNNIDRMKALAGLKQRITQLRASTGFQTREITAQYGGDFPALPPALADVEAKLAAIDATIQSALDSTTVTNAEKIAYADQVISDSRAGKLAAAVADSKLA